MRDKLLPAARISAPAMATDRMPTPPNVDHPGRASTAPRRKSTAEPPILLAPWAVVSSLFSFEALLLLYMFAGSYKADPRLAWIPVDPTGMFFALSIAVGSFIIIRNPIYKKALPIVFAMVCLVVWLWVSLSWSPSRAYGPDKVLLMSTLVLWAVIAGALIIAPDRERLRRLFTLLLLFALWVGSGAVMSYGQTSGEVERITDLESGSYLTVGRIGGLGVLIALVGWLYCRGRVAGWVCLGLFVALGFVLALAGGRAPLLATAIPLLIPIGLSVRLTTRKIRYSRTLLWVLLLPLVMSVGFALYTTMTEQRLGTIERLQRLAGGDFSGSEAVRADQYAETNDIWQQAPLLGRGTGSWPLLAGFGDQKNYPHNLVLELLAENGLVGLILFLMLLAVALRPISLERLRHDPQALCAMMLFINAFLNAMTTADLVGNRAVFMMLGVLALFAIRQDGAATPARVPRQAAARLDLSLARQRRAATERSR